MKAAPSPVSFAQYRDKRNSKHPSVSEETAAAEAEFRMFEVATPAGGFNSGRTYYLRADSSASSDEWIRELKRMVKEAKSAHDRLSRIVNLQTEVRRIYVSTPTQTIVAFLILGNFVLSAYETQLNPQTQHGLDTFKRIDLIFTLLFTVVLPSSFSASLFVAVFRFLFSLPRFGPLRVSLAISSTTSPNLDTLF
eukprot:2260063-Rhodomonas_salina.1